MTRALTLALAIVAAGCDASLDCAGVNCSCSAGATCDFRPACGAGTFGCDLNCQQDATCTGTCGDSCNGECGSGARCTITAGNSANLSCLGGTCTLSGGAGANVHCTAAASCTATVGQSGRVSCDDGAVCHITCASSCMLSCTGATCDYTCPGAASSLPVGPTGATCP